MCSSLIWRQWRISQAAESRNCVQFDSLEWSIVIVKQHTWWSFLHKWPLKKIKKSWTWHSFYCILFFDAPKKMNKNSAKLGTTLTGLCKQIKRATLSLHLGSACFSVLLLPYQLKMLPSADDCRQKYERNCHVGVFFDAQIRLCAFFRIKIHKRWLVDM